MIDGFAKIIIVARGGLDKELITKQKIMKKTQLLTSTNVLMSRGRFTQSLMTLVMIFLMVGCQKDQDIDVAESFDANEMQSSRIGIEFNDQKMVLPSSVNKRTATFRQFWSKHLQRAAAEMHKSIDAKSMVIACPPEGLVIAAKTKGHEPSQFVYLQSPESPSPIIARGIILHVIFIVEPTGIRYVSLRSLDGSEMFRLPIFDSPPRRSQSPLSLSTGVPNPYSDNQGDDPYVCVDDGDNGTYYLDFTDLSCQQSPTGEPVCEQ